MINTVVDISLLGLLLATALLMLRSHSPLTITILSSIYSLVLCTLFVVLDAVDVAFTEAAVGAGISTVLFVAVIQPNDEVGHGASNGKFGDLKPTWPSVWSICVGLAVGILLVFGTTDMPLFGDPAAAVHQHLVPRFLGQSATEIGIANVVTSVLASYRGYDTLGEVVVVFTAGMAVLLLLAGDVGNKATRRSARRAPLIANPLLIANPVIKTILLRIIPVVLLFALYVQFHGDYGPGGGFQAGVIFAVALITFGLLADAENLHRVISERILVLGMALGVLLYGAVGVATILLGGDFLDYSVLSESQTSGQHLGVFLIELGVGITVASTMLSLFISFYRQQDALY